MRKQKKRELKKLWIKQINAATKEHGIKYNQFMHGLHISGTEINRKMLSELARLEPLSFYSLVQLSTLSRKVAAAALNPEADQESTFPYKLYDFPKEFDAEYSDFTQLEYNSRTENVEKAIEKALESERLEDLKFEETLRAELQKKKQKDDLYFGAV